MHQGSRILLDRQIIHVSHDSSGYLSCSSNIGDIYQLVHLALLELHRSKAGSSAATCQWFPSHYLDIMASQSETLAPVLLPNPQQLVKHEA